MNFGKELADACEQGGKMAASLKDGASEVGVFLNGEDVKPVHKGYSIVYGILPTENVPDVDCSSLHPTFGIFAPKGFFAAAFTDNDRSQLYWLSVKASKPGQKLSSDEIRSQEHERCKEVFFPVSQIIEATNIFFAWDIYELPPFWRRSQSSAVLIGDAAHALPPNKRQRVSQAIENVFVLVRVIEAGSELERYAGVRTPRVEN